jgi:hypothetical protein
MQDREYEYKPRWSFILLAVLFCAAGAVVFAALAHWRQPVVGFGVKMLTADKAEVFWWCFVAADIGMFLYVVLLAVLRLVRIQRIVFTPTAIIVPKSRLSSTEITIPYSAITDVSFSKGNGQRLLRITHEGGKNTISSWFLATNEGFDEVHHLVEELVGQVRGNNTDAGRPG